MSRRPPREEPASRQASLKPGSAGSKAAFSYYASRPKTSASTSFWKRGWIKNLPSFVALAAVTISVAYSLSLSPNPRLIMADHSGVKVRNPAAYQQVAQQILSRSIFSRTKFTINIDAFEHDFRAEFPEVSEVSVALPLIGRRPVVSVATARPALLMTARGQAYVLDKNGRAIMRAADLDSALRAKLPVVNDQSGLAAKPGQTVLPSKNVNFIFTVIAQFRARQLVVNSLVLPAVPHELDVRIDGQSYYIKFDLDTNDREAAGAFMGVKQYLDEHNVKPAAYVDVRVPGRAYYK